MLFFFHYKKNENNVLATFSTVFFLHGLAEAFLIKQVTLTGLVQPLSRSHEK